MLRRIRDLNDEINKLIREKGHWEVRIVELGGPDYAKAAPKVQDSQGFEIQGATGKGAGYRQAHSASGVPWSNEHCIVLHVCVLRQGGSWAEVIPKSLRACTCLPLCVTLLARVPCCCGGTSVPSLAT